MKPAETAHAAFSTGAATKSADKSISAERQNRQRYRNPFLAKAGAMRTESKATTAVEIGVRSPPRLGWVSVGGIQWREF